MPEEELTSQEPVNDQPEAVNTNEAIPWYIAQEIAPSKMLLILPKLEICPPRSLR